jgi:phytoene dehydrogenase-like protein
MMEVGRLLTMTVAELLDEWFENDLLKGTLGAAGISGMFQGPMAAGTAYMLLHNRVGMDNGALRSTYRVHGGIGVLSRALGDLARSCGAEIRTSTPVVRVTIKNGRATGVVLENGDEVTADRVISNADPRHTFLSLVDPVELTPRFVRQVRNIKYRGACAKVNLALDTLPNFTSGEAAHLGGVVSISPSLAYLERAYDDAKYGDISREPYLEAVIPSVNDPSLAPHGKHVMSILVQYAPYHLKRGAWDQSTKNQLAEHVIKTLAQYAPNLEQIILAQQVGPGLGPLSHADREPVSVRCWHTPRWRGDWKTRVQRRPRDPEGRQTWEVIGIPAASAGSPPPRVPSPPERSPLPRYRAAPPRTRGKCARDLPCLG